MSLNFSLCYRKSCWKERSGLFFAPLLVPLGDPPTGEMAEWFKVHAWKACVRLKPYRGFESLSLRQCIILCLCFKNKKIEVRLSTHDLSSIEALVEPDPYGS
jgi:hypothetical protein